MQQPLDSAAGDTAFDAVYARLHQIAQRERKRLGARATLNTTALVHEAYLDLCKNADPASIRNFYAYAARAMRNLLIDAARQRLAARRGGNAAHVDLDAVDQQGVGSDAMQALELDAALRELAASEPRCAEVVELHYFAGLALERVAELLGISTRTVHRDWQFARAWLQQAMTP
ncbi:MAG: sigma-70 family RNA polymerase sigma factor [Dokdonella sp.]|uniref:ECF-type sigma factor n=1 Tax=Dokdonella sp. TaxID=2291710 RepID=UPI0025C32994|nr:ECF-type sigma factor [Dokdonella sp.]MBZ0221448.1 sigma-70 family RNA polymerase sigma factor [Dokdonella sp.]